MWLVIKMEARSMPKQTPLYDLHKKHGGLMVDFAGWDMPLHYGSQIEEHHKVRNDSGMFDVSHMGVADIEGKDVQPFLKYLLANNIGKLKEPFRALYTCMLNEEGGIIDDLIVYYINPNYYRLVINAATTEKDLNWIQKVASGNFNVSVKHQPELAIIAVQGPNAREKVGKAFPHIKDKIDALKPFQFFIQDKWLVARTGYTGEDGIEIILPKNQSVNCWQTLNSVSVSPIGLGARDTLRLEAGLNLYGQDMDESVTPLESNLAWTVSFDENRPFIGRSALEKQKQEGIKQKLVGLKLIDKGVLRHDQIVLSSDAKTKSDAEPIGKITSGSFSPTLKQSIAMARVDNSLENECLVDIRGKHLKAQIVKTPFVRR